jgi:NAD dependent epimerase/dehydratase family
MCAYLVIGDDSALYEALVARMRRQYTGLLLALPWSSDALFSPDRLRHLIETHAIGRIFVVTYDFGFNLNDQYNAQHLLQSFTNLLQAVQDLHAEKKAAIPIHIISSADVFGACGPGRPYLNEASPYQPETQPAEFRAALNQLAVAQINKNGMQISISYPTTVLAVNSRIGPPVGQLIDASLTSKRWPLYGDGGSTSDYIWVEDAAAAVLFGAERLQDNHFDENRKIPFTDKFSNGQSEIIHLSDQKFSTLHTHFGVGNGQCVNDRTFLGLLAQSIDRVFAANPQLARQYPKSPMASGLPCVSLITSVVDRRCVQRHVTYQWTQTPWMQGLPPPLGLRDTLQKLVTQALRADERFPRPKQSVA